MATVYVLVCTTNPRILTVICCIYYPTHPMSKIPFPILNFLDSDVCAVMTLIFLTNLKKCVSFSKNVAILLLSFKQPITALNKLIDSQHYKRHKRKRMTRHQRTLFIQLIHSCFSRYQVPTNSVAPSSVYKAYTTHNSSICSDEGLTLETSAFQSLYGGQFALSTPLINQIFVNLKSICLYNK